MEKHHGQIDIVQPDMGYMWALIHYYFIFRRLSNLVMYQKCLEKKIYKYKKRTSHRLSDKSSDAGGTVPTRGVTNPSNHPIRIHRFVLLNWFGRKKIGKAVEGNGWKKRARRGELVSDRSGNVAPAAPLFDPWPCEEDWLFDIQSGLGRRGNARLIWVWSRCLGSLSGWSARHL